MQLSSYDTHVPMMTDPQKRVEAHNADTMGAPEAHSDTDTMRMHTQTETRRSVHQAQKQKQRLWTNPVL